ncbi:thiolase family protein [Pseudomonas sp. PDM22]|uniref:thiolase family protein n=1 Tax=Pseudomonas sp. PDM22 TaxID=2769287 RepID=UPI0009DA222E|nr:thiolase family protein [Pseudomonas sp. PDM22]MBD9518180.1 thiolase family protein [Pseudomonas sp. PDM22]OQR33090.1 acetyl-CoA acetyltransferase [Pseudomonas sp. T]
MNLPGLFSAFDDALLVEAVRTPWIDYRGALAAVSPTDLGIFAGRSLLRRSAVDPTGIDSVLAGNMAQASFDAYMLPRHIGLYCGVPQQVPALGVQRICGTGLELLRQGAEQIQRGQAASVLCVASESMSRNPIASYSHRGGFTLGQPVEFKDFLWEALFDPAVSLSMMQTAENLARRHGLRREEVDAYALRSFQRALQAQADGWFAGEIEEVREQTFEQAGLAPRHLKLSGRNAEAAQDSHIRETSAEALARLGAIYPEGVQTAGNSCAVVDGAAAALLMSTSAAAGRPVLAHLRAAAVIGVDPAVMGIGPAPAIRLLLQGSGLRLDQIGYIEINEAQAAQVLAVQRELELDDERLNRHGGAIALGHPLAATGLRLAHTVARQMAASGQRYGIASACIGGGQGMAVLLENPRPAAFN